MSQPNFEEVVHNICKNIKGKRCRSEAQEELLGHLEDTYERNIATGKSGAEAYDLAVKSLGNTRLLSQQLAAVHDNSPASQMKSALWLFIFGFILRKIHIEFFTGMKEICIFIGVIMTLFALYLMRTVNKKMRLGFIFYTVHFAVEIINDCVVCYGVKNDIFNYSYIILSNAFLLLMWIFVTLGFMEMNKSYCSDSEKRRPFLGFVLVYMPLEIAVSCGLVIMNEGQSIDGEMGMIVLVLFAVYIFILIQFIKLKNRLWDADARYGIDSWNRKNIAAACMAVAVSIVCPMFFMYSYAVKDTPKTELVIHDTDNENEADEIRRQMLSLGVDGNILSALPDSEVMNYKDAIAMEQMAGRDDMGEKAIWTGYNFYFYDEAENKMKMRSLHTFEMVDCSYRAGFYYINSDNLIHTEPNEEDDIYISVLQKQGNKFYKKDPINCDFSSMHSMKGCENGFDFKAEENQMVIIALSTDIRVNDSCFNTFQGFAFVTQRIPFTLSYSTVEDFAKSTCSGNWYRDTSDLFLEGHFVYDMTVVYPPDIIAKTTDSEPVV